MTDTKDLPGFRIPLGPLVITWRSLFAARIKYVPRYESGTPMPLFERLRTMQETEEPWRKGTGAIFRLWPTRHAIMLGWWGDPQVPDDAGEKRALASVLGQGTSGTASGAAVTRLLGPATQEEIAERVAAVLGPEEDAEDITDSFTMTDLRDDKAI